MLLRRTKFVPLVMEEIGRVEEEVWKKKNKQKFRKMEFLGNMRMERWMGMKMKMMIVMVMVVSVMSMRILVLVVVRLSMKTLERRKVSKIVLKLIVNVKLKKAVTPKDAVTLAKSAKKQVGMAKEQAVVLKTGDKTKIPLVETKTTGTKII